MDYGNNQQDCVSAVLELRRWVYGGGKGPSSVCVELDIPLRVELLFLGLPCDRVTAGRSPPEGRGLDAVTRLCQLNESRQINTLKRQALINESILNNPKTVHPCGFPVK